MVYNTQDYRIFGLSPLCGIIMLESGKVKKFYNSNFKMILKYLYRKHSLEEGIGDIFSTF
jgi:hypothetical protein